MLPRRNDGHDLARVEATIMAAAMSYPPLSPERMELLRYRILFRLGPQDQSRPFYAPLLRERWVSVPVAGVGLAAALIAANRFVLDGDDSGPRGLAQATGDVTVDGVGVANVEPGELMLARSLTWLSFDDDLQFGLEAGSSATYREQGELIEFHLLSGDVTVINKSRDVRVVHEGLWAASVEIDTVARFQAAPEGGFVAVTSGRVALSLQGATYIVTPDDSPLLIPAATEGGGDGEDESPDPGSQPSGDDSNGSGAFPFAPGGGDDGTGDSNDDAGPPAATEEPGTDEVPNSVGDDADDDPVPPAVVDPAPVPPGGGGDDGIETPAPDDDGPVLPPSGTTGGDDGETGGEPPPPALGSQPLPPGGDDDDDDPPPPATPGGGDDDDPPPPATGDGDDDDDPPPPAVGDGDDDDDPPPPATGDGDDDDDPPPATGDGDDDDDDAPPPATGDDDDDDGVPPPPTDSDDDVDPLPPAGVGSAAESVDWAAGLLQEIIDANPGTPAADKLEDALGKLEVASASLEQSPPDRQAFAGGLESVMGDLESAVSSGYLTPAQGNAIMQELASAARITALEAIAEAVTANGDPVKIADAQAAVAAGDAALDLAQFKNAAARYKDAVAKAESA